jgi:hypothetical protein
VKFVRIRKGVTQAALEAMAKAYPELEATTIDQEYEEMIDGDKLQPLDWSKAYFPRLNG